jgi:hypothetical protein
MPGTMITPIHDGDNILLEPIKTAFGELLDVRRRSLFLRLAPIRVCVETVTSSGSADVFSEETWGIAEAFTVLRWPETSERRLQIATGESRAVNETEISLPTVLWSSTRRTSTGNSDSSAAVRARLSSPPSIRRSISDWRVIVLPGMRDP